MKTFNIKWSVTEIINGPGEHDDGVRDGDRTIVASGEVDKEADSADTLHTDLLTVLKGAFPEQGLGPTYNIDRIYDIVITQV